MEGKVHVLFGGCCHDLMLLGSIFLKHYLFFIEMHIA